MNGVMGSGCYIVSLKLRGAGIIPRHTKNNHGY